MSITFIIKFNVNTADLTNFNAIMQDVKTGLPQVEGCNHVEIYQNAETDTSFTLVENWQTKQAHQTHIENLSNNGEWDKIAKLLSADPDGHYFNPV
ncbi:MAG: antibiotic biosynthesis monooxygenase [Hyphomicrobiales bacterium]